MTVKSYKARRRLQMAPGVWREPGELVPEAYTWWRLESWVHTGNLEEVEIEEDELRAAIEQFCPEQGEKIRELAGLSEAVLEGPRNAPRIVATKRKPGPKAD